MKIIKNLAFGTDAAQTLDIYLPEGETKALVVYLHGGGLIRGDKSAGATHASYLTERGIAVASADYRLYPTAKYPDFIRDGAAATALAYKYMKEELGCDRLYVVGTSAGGYISMMLCFNKEFLGEVGLDNSAISGYIHNAGQPTAHFKVLEHEGVNQHRIIVDERAPLYYIGLEEKYPPMLFIVSDNDMVNRYEETMLTLSALRTFGYSGFDHIVMHSTHCGYCRVGEDGRNIFAEMVYDFIESAERSDAL
ncbi:MAG: alpha/beta hydrolase [Clostridia bacterium]|nr:alpha/beta hydrolase [Clostridia bacterium]